MSHSIRVDSKSALVGVAAALVCVVAFGQVSVSRATTPTAAIAPGYGIGNPHPKDMVHFTTWDDVFPLNATAGNVTIPVGGEHEIFVVPADKWLVVVPNGASNSGQYSGVGLGVWAVAGNVQLLEDLGGVLSFKARNESGGIFSQGDVGPATNTLGWTFAPGSRVVLRSWAGYQDPVKVSYNLFGYLVSI